VIFALKTKYPRRAGFLLPKNDICNMGELDVFSIYLQNSNNK
jgi:hypothetical protein